MSFKKGTKVNKVEPRVGRLVFLDGSGVIVLTSDNVIDMADLESLGDTEVGNIMPQVRRSVFPDSSEMIDLGTSNIALKKIRRGSGKLTAEIPNEYAIVDNRQMMRYSQSACKE